jgi:hypothetical protein
MAVLEPKIAISLLVLWICYALVSFPDTAEAFGVVRVGVSSLRRHGWGFHGRISASSFACRQPSRNEMCRWLSHARGMHTSDGSSLENTSPRLSIKNTSIDLSLDKSKSHFSAKLAFLEGSRLYEDTDFYTLSVWKTPLWMITQEPDLNNLVQYLQDLRLEILSAPKDSHLIRFSRAKIEAARSAFSRMVRRGEMRLHRLCELTADEILGGNYTRQSVVVGQRPTRDQQRFQLVQPLSAEELYANTDLDLGSRQLDRFMWQTVNRWQRAALVANFVEYQVAAAGEHDVAGG